MRKPRSTASRRCAARDRPSPKTCKVLAANVFFRGRLDLAQLRLEGALISFAVILVTAMAVLSFGQCGDVLGEAAQPAVGQAALFEVT